MRKTIGLLLSSAMLVVGVVLCNLSSLQIDVPDRPPVDEAFNPQAPEPDFNMITPEAPDPEDAPDDSAAPPPDTPTPTPLPTLELAAAQPPPSPTPTPTLPPLPNTLNIILLGTDHQGNATDWRTDTMIVLMIDPQTRQAGVVSLPRDLWVNIPNRAPNRINTLDEFGGPPLVKKVVGATLGIPIDYYVRIDFPDFVKAIDAIGGITVDVDCKLTEANKVMFPKGITQMNGTQALEYARLRHSTSIFDRMRRQSRVLWAIRDKLLSPDMFPRVPAIFDAAHNLVQTDIPAATILPLANLARDMKASDIHGLIIDYRQSRHVTGPQGAWILMPNFDAIRTAVRTIFVGTTLTDAVSKPAPAICKD